MAVARILLHLHLPKTGGMTLNHYIYDQLHTSEYYVGERGFLHAGVYYFPDGFFSESSKVNDEVRRILKRADLRAVIGHFRFGIHEYTSRPTTYVTVLRHPVERVLSLFYHLNHPGTLEGFVREPPIREIDNDQTRRISGIDPPVGECTSCMLDLAKHNLMEYFGVVGTTPRLYETVLLLKRTFHWERELVCYFQNTNPSRPATTQIGDSVQQAILERNQLDLEIFKFAENLLQERVDREGPAFAEEYEALRSDLSLPAVRAN